MKHALRVLACLGCVAVPSLSASGQVPMETTRGETSVTVVEIPVEVTRRGEPVRGLGRDDFRVTSDGEPLPIVGFEAVDLGTPETPGPRPTAPAARRHLLLLFDLGYTHPQDLGQAVVAARRLVAEGLHPSDLVAVALYDPRRGVPLLLTFTTDRAALDGTLATLEEAFLGERAAPPRPGAVVGLDPLGLTGPGNAALLTVGAPLEGRNALLEALGEVPPGGGRGGFLLRNILGHAGTLTEAEVAENERHFARAYAAAIEDLARALAPIEGRKALVLFSAGFPFHPEKPGGRRGSFASGVGNPAAVGGTGIPELERMLSVLRRSGWTVQAVDAAGARAPGFRADGLFFAANETGGRLVEATGDLAGGLARALAPSRVSYLLAVQVPDLPFDGAFHPLEVTLPNAGRGVRTHHREGFYAPRLGERPTDAQRLTEATLRLSGVEEGDDLGLRVAALPFPPGADGIRVPVLLEIAGGPIVGGGDTEVEILGYAFDREGAARAHFANVVAIDPSKVGGRLAEGGIRYLATLDLPPESDLRLRVLVQARPSGRYALRTVALPSATAGAEALFLPGAEDPWVEARPSGEAVRLHGREMVVALHGELAPGGDAPLLLVGPELAAPGIGVAGRVLDGAGRPTQGRLDLLVRSAGENGQPDVVVGRLLGDELPPGDYLLEVKVTRGGESAWTVRPFKVRG